jgi:hypothetical protein
MKKLVSILLVLCSNNLIAQECTREIAQSVPTILEIGFNKKPYAVKDPFGKKLGDALYSIFAASIQQSKGLHGNFNITEANNHLPGLSGYHAYAAMFYVYCRKDGKLDWKGLSDLGFNVTSNYITGDIGNELINEQVGTGGNHFVYLDNNCIYTLHPRKTGSEINGYPYLEAVAGNKDNAVLITKRGTPFFIPVTRIQYLRLMKRSAEASLAILKNALAESKKEKLGLEDAITISINYSLNDIKQIDAFIAGHYADYLNKPCITDHNLESMFGKSFADEPPYFFDRPGSGKEWVMINPVYLNKSLQPKVPQFFSVTWSRGEKEVEKKAALLFKQTFDFKKMEELLGK